MVNPDEAAAGGSDVVQRVSMMQSSIAPPRFNLGEDFSVFMEILEEHFKVASVSDAMKVPVLLTTIHLKVYEVIRELTFPRRPNEYTFVELTELMSTQFGKHESVWRKRIEFFELRQGSGESVSEWHIRIKCAAMSCKFGNMLNENVRNKFVSGLKNKRVLDRLCEETEAASLDNLVMIAISKEGTLQQSEVQINHLQKQQINVHKEKRKTGESSKKNEKQDINKKGLCYACGKGNHNFIKCKFKSYVCKGCNTKGHIVAACPSKVKVDSKFLEVEEVNFYYNDVGNSNNDATYIDLKVNNIVLKSEIDCGAGKSVLPLEIFKNSLNGNVNDLKETCVRLKTYDGRLITPVGMTRVSVGYRERKFDYEMLVVKTSCWEHPLVGRDLMKLFGIKINVSCQNLEPTENAYNEACNNVTKEFADLFDGSLGKFNRAKVSLSFKENAVPKFCKPRPIPFAFKEDVEKEIDRCEAEGIITKIENSEWGTPLVCVLKENGKVRVCADYRCTVNQFLEEVQYPFPRIEELFQALQGGTLFSKIDFTNAYNQLELDPETGMRLAWSTHKGIYRMNRLPFGTSPACAIFQREIEKVLRGCTGVINLLDDIVVTGHSFQEHVVNLRKVLSVLRDCGFKLNLAKCEFFKPEIEYLGHVVNKDGLKKNQNKVAAMLDAPRPTNVTELRSFIGMVNYYGKFVPKIAEILSPLHELTGSVPFIWSKRCDEAFMRIKKELISEKVLVHFNPQLPLIVECDASGYGISAVLSHLMRDGSERPICYISRTLKKAERNYSATQREALAIYWAVRKLYQFLMGLRFTIRSDHKPLETIFSSTKGIPQMTTARLQRWALYLSSFDYKLEYISGKSNLKADCLSRLPLKQDTEEDFEFDYIHWVENFVPVDFNMIRNETRKDQVFGKIFNYISTSWPNSCKEDSEILPFYRRKSELSIENGVIIWGYRVLIPSPLRGLLLKELHSTHLGATKMKGIARSYFWWPNLDKEIEGLSNSCEICIEHRPEQEKSVLIKWPLTSKVFERIHLDHAGPFKGRTFLIMVDSYSKWVEIFEVSSATTKTTLKYMREVFARLGLPAKIMTDNGTAFTSAEFERFCELNGIIHLKPAPFHPSSNGAAENSVKTFKRAIEKMVCENPNEELHTHLQRFLFNYRNSIHCTTGINPSELICKFKVNNRFDRIKFNCKDTCESQVKNYKGQKARKELSVGDKVFIRNYRSHGKKWVKAIVQDVIGNTMYKCKELETDIITKRHVDQLIFVEDFVSDSPDSIPVEKSKLPGGYQLIPRNFDNIIDRPANFNNKLDSNAQNQDDNTSSNDIMSDVQNNVNDTDTNIQNNITKENENNAVITRPKRIVKVPKRLITEM